MVGASARITQNTDDPEMSSGVRARLGIYLLGSGSFRILMQSLNSPLFQTSCMDCVTGTGREKTPGGCLLLGDFSGRSGFCCFCHVFSPSFSGTPLYSVLLFEEDLEGSVFF